MVRHNRGGMNNKVFVSGMIAKAMGDVNRLNTAEQYGRVDQGLFGTLACSVVVLDMGHRLAGIRFRGRACSSVEFEGTYEIGP